MLPTQYATKIVAAMKLFFVCPATLDIPIVIIRLTVPPKKPVIEYPTTGAAARVQRAPAECRDDERPEATNGAVNRVCRRHHQGNQPDLDIEHSFLQLRPLELRTSHPCLSMSQPLHRRESLLRGEKPRRHGRIRHDEAEQPKQKLPGNDAHEAGGDDALHEPQEEALHVEALVCCHGGREHADGCPHDDHAAEDAADVEALQGECHGVQTCQHAEIKERCGPAETAGVDTDDHGRYEKHVNLPHRARSNDRVNGMSLLAHNGDSFIFAVRTLRSLICLIYRRYHCSDIGGYLD
ncbi:hypothetical protein HG530_011975 [Fusarium avenaceum]|nr:hypothetical protein HG530_011975 [Fusarium avenaceum]